MTSFLNGHLSSAQRDRWQAPTQRPKNCRPPPGRTDSIPERDQRPCDNGYKSIFTISWLVCQGIRQKSTKRVNSFIVRSAFCPGPLNRDPMDSEKQLHVYTSGRTMACHVWRVDKAPGHTHRNRNACLKVLRFVRVHVHTASDANWLRANWIICFYIHSNYPDNPSAFSWFNLFR